MEGDTENRLHSMEHMLKDINSKLNTIINSNNERFKNIELINKDLRDQNTNLRLMLGEVNKKLSEKSFHEQRPPSLEESPKHVPSRTRSGNHEFWPHESARRDHDDQVKADSKNNGTPTLYQHAHHKLGGFAQFQAEILAEIEKTSEDQMLQKYTGNCAAVMKVYEGMEDVFKLIEGGGADFFKTLPGTYYLLLTFLYASKSHQGFIAIDRSFVQDLWVKKFYKTCTVEDFDKLLDCFVIPAVIHIINGQLNCNDDVSHILAKLYLVRLEDKFRAYYFAYRSFPRWFIKNTLEFPVFFKESAKYEDMWEALLDQPDFFTDYENRRDVISWLKQLPPAIIRKIFLQFKGRFGEDDPNTVMIGDSLVQALRWNKETAEDAAFFARDLWNSKIRKYGDFNKKSLHGGEILAQCLNYCGKHSEAVKVRNKMVESCVKGLGANHPTTMEEKFHLANDLKDEMNDRDTALEIYNGMLPYAQRCEEGSDGIYYNVKGGPMFGPKGTITRRIILAIRELNNPDWARE